MLRESGPVADFAHPFEPTGRESPLVDPICARKRARIGGHRRKVRTLTAAASGAVSTTIAEVREELVGIRDVPSGATFAVAKGHGTRFVFVLRSGNSWV